jgi:hypothetical protein
MMACTTFQTASAEAVASVQAGAWGTTVTWSATPVMDKVGFDGGPRNLTASLENGTVHLHWEGIATGVFVVYRNAIPIAHVEGTAYTDSQSPALTVATYYVTQVVGPNQQGGPTNAVMVLGNMICPVLYLTEVHDFPFLVAAVGWQCLPWPANAVVGSMVRGPPIPVVRAGVL